MSDTMSVRRLARAVAAAARRRPWVALGAALLIVLVLLTGWAFSTYGAPRIASSAVRIARETQRTASAFPTASLIDRTGFEEAYETLTLAEAARRSEPQDAEAPWREAVRAALEFLWGWSVGDPDQYLRWGRDHGMNLPGGFPIYQSWTMDVYAARYLDVVGRPMPENMSFETYYRDYFTSYFTRIGAALRPVGVAVDPRAMLVNTAKFTHWSEYITTDPDQQAGGLGAEFWLGKIGYSGMMMLWPEEAIPTLERDDPSTARWEIGTINDARRLLFDPVIREYGSVLAAEVRLVYLSETGISVPVVIWMKQRPSDGIWRVDGMGISNVDSSVGVLKAPAYAPPF